MTPEIQRTSLWAISLGATGADQEIEKKKERLRTALQNCRDRVKVLVTGIAATFPQLTVHDITHLDALWETADIVAGKDYPLNPLEAFVLGGAILLHDAAHCFEAYEGGKSAVRSTVEWRDAFASEKAAHPDEPYEQIEQYCDFTAIRLLHANQAEKLGEQEWKSTVSGTSFFLIEDVDLRFKYGALIGKIAASHNWNIDDVKAKLPAQINAPGGWPNEWRVDPIKIACLLRCADAAHIDDRRAPDFLLALIRRSGVSLDHWKAQNWLSRVDVDQSDPGGSSLLITSTHAFRPDDANAWWVAYDAVAILDSEIRASNNLLMSRAQRNSGSPAFRMHRVTGANSPSELAKSIQTDGWIPTSARIHVGNLERLVETLGGQNLYGSSGDNFAIVLRELIQNARDAIAARRSITHGFVGQIFIRVTSKSATQTYIEVRDDGVGMSERTITGALLDFGTSFWASDLVRSEFPGLRSSSFRPVGKFGIGFYSVFMAASEVLVASKRFDEGLLDVTKLHFPDGLTLRPILSKGADRTYEASTSIRLTIDENIDLVRDRQMNLGNHDQELSLPLRDYLSAITAGLDVSVVLQIENESPVTVHENIESLSTSETMLNWIKSITFAEVPNFSGSVRNRDYCNINAGRIRRIEDNGRLVGLAALLDMNCFGFQCMTTDTIGGLTNQVMRGAVAYLGYMESYPASAKRDVATKIAPNDVLQSWANEQVRLLQEQNANQEQLYWAASNMANMELDPIDVISFPVVFDANRYVLLGFDQIFDLLCQTPFACIRDCQLGFAETHIQPTVFENLPTLRPVTTGGLIHSKIEDGRPTHSFSLIGCLDRLVRRRGRELVYEVRGIPLRSIAGPLEALIIRLQAA